MQQWSKIKMIILLSSFFLCFVILLSFLGIKKKFNTTCGTKEPQLICGITTLTNNARKGKELFNSNCAACHHLEKQMTGPALRGIKDQNTQLNSFFLFRFVTKEDSLLLMQDTLAISLNKKSNYKFNHTFSFSEEEFTFLLDYLE